MQEVLVKLAVTDPHTASILFRFCVGSRLIYWMRTPPLHWGGRQTGLNNKLTQRTMRRLVMDSAYSPQQREVISNGRSHFPLARAV